MHLERNFALDARKYLRSFSSTEAAEFLGLAPGHLRKLHAEDKIPDVPLDEFLDVNPAMVKMFGYESREAMLAIDIPTAM